MDIHGYTPPKSNNASMLHDSASWPGSSWVFIASIGQDRRRQPRQNEATGALLQEYLTQSGGIFDRYLQSETWGHPVCVVLRMAHSRDMSSGWSSQGDPSYDRPSLTRYSCSELASNALDLLCHLRQFPLHASRRVPFHRSELL